jgi:DNA-binding Lrp family transcriptional regulator
VWEIRFPQPEIDLNKTDWKIVDAMLDDARQSLEEVSRSTGISVRTVERRLRTMSEERTVYLQGTPHLNFMGVSCVFLVFCPAGGEKKRTVDESILAKVGRIELANTTGNQYSTFVTLFDNLSQADDFLSWIENLVGVQSAKMGIMNELIVVQDWLRRKVRERV